MNVAFNTNSSLENYSTTYSFIHKKPIFKQNSRNASQLKSLTWAEETVKKFEDRKKNKLISYSLSWKFSN